MNIVYKFSRHESTIKHCKYRRITHAGLARDSLCEKLQAMLACGERVTPSNAFFAKSTAMAVAFISDSPRQVVLTPTPT